MERFLTVAGLGPGDPALLPALTWQALHRAAKVFLRTEQHPVVPELRRQGISFTAMDRHYEEASTFAEVYRRIVAEVLSAADSQRGAVVYCVPGHPMVAETTVQWLLAEAQTAGVEVEVIPALSCLEAIYGALRLDPARGLVILDALEISPAKAVPAMGCLVTQVYDRRVASEVKLALMERYPDEHMVTVVRAAGVPGEQRITEAPLYEVDRLTWLDHLTTLYVPPYLETVGEPHQGELQPGDPNLREPQPEFPAGQAGYPLDALVTLMQTLRGDQGCPWDKEQTHQSLRPYLIEEAYEVLDALESGDMYNFCEELGDLLLQVVFHAQLAREAGLFDINDVVLGITSKMVRRHPHVFGDVQADTPAAVLVNWDRIKAAEKPATGQRSALDVPRVLPALMRAEKVQKIAARAGFDWPEVSGAWQKISEELGELKEALPTGDEAAIQEETGDVLFAVVNVARFLGVHPEEALDRAIEKFSQRFRFVEGAVREQGREMEKMTIEELDFLWEQAKKVR